MNENKKQDKTICDDEHVHEGLKSINYKKKKRGVNIRLTCKHKDEYVSLSYMVTCIIIEN